MNYEQRYKEALKAVKELQEANLSDDGIQNWVNEKFPELRESEDDRIRKGIIRNLEYLADRAEGFVKDELKERIAWLEKQGTSYTKKDIDDAYVEGMAFAKNELEKQKTDWSEEDETNSYHLKTLLENLAKDNKYEFRIISDNDRDKYTAWLKSLKQRHTWKPTEEQIEALERCVDYLNESDNEDAGVIDSLCHGLKLL